MMLTTEMRDKLQQDRARFAQLVKLLPLEDMVNIFCTMIEERSDLTEPQMRKLEQVTGRLAWDLLVVGEDDEPS